MVGELTYQITNHVECPSTGSGLIIAAYQCRGILTEEEAIDSGEKSYPQPHMSRQGRDTSRQAGMSTAVADPECFRDTPHESNLAK